MTAHEEIERAEAYALGALDADERAAYEKHLAACAGCRRAVADASVASTAVGLAVEPAALPPGSGDRLVARFRSDVQGALPGGKSGGTRGGGTRGGGAGAGMALLMATVAVLGLAFGGWSRAEVERERDRADRAESEAKALRDKVEDCHRERAKEKLDADRLAQLSRILVAPDVTGVTLKGSDPALARASVEVKYSPTRGVALIADALPDPPAGKVYKLWALEAGKNPAPMGTLELAGAGAIHVEGPRAGAALKFAVSLEDAPGDVTAPTKVVLLPG